MGTSSIRVAHVVQSLQVGGLERVVVNLILGLKNSEFECRVYCLDEAGSFASQLEVEGVAVQVLGKSAGISWRAIGELSRSFRRDRIQVVHTHNMSAHLHGCLAARLARVPFCIHTKHGRDYPDNPRKVRLNRWLSWFTDVIVPVSDDAAQVCLQIEKVKPGKVRRIWNGVDTRLYQPRSRDQRSEAGGQRPEPAGSLDTGAMPPDDCSREASSRPTANAAVAGNTEEDCRLKTEDRRLTPSASRAQEDASPFPLPASLDGGPEVREQRSEVSTASSIQNRRCELPTANRPLIVGTVARLSPEKDQKTMLRAFKLLLAAQQRDGRPKTEDGRLISGASRESAVGRGSPDPARSSTAGLQITAEGQGPSHQSSVFSLQSTSPALGQEPQSSVFSLQSSVSKQPRPRLIVVGDGPCRADLEALAAELGIAGQVDFLGARSDVASLLPQFSLFALSSLTEGISMTILEAMACGVPIVASDVGGNREIVQPPACGLIVAPRDAQALADAWGQLLDSPETRDGMSERARRRVVQEFSLETMVSMYKQTYRHCGAMESQS